MPLSGKPLIYTSGDGRQQQRVYSSERVKRETLARLGWTYQVAREDAPVEANAEALPFDDGDHLHPGDDEDPEGDDESLSTDAGFPPPPPEKRIVITPPATKTPAAPRRATSNTGKRGG